LGDRKGIHPIVVGDDLTGAKRLTDPLVTTTSIILSINKIQDGDILVPANPGPLGKIAVKMEREGASKYKGKFHKGALLLCEIRGSLE